MRRLAAILTSDVVGFSAMMAEDEDGTLARLIGLRKTQFDPAVARHSGRTVKLTGDGALVEFASVADAVNCAVDIQTALAKDTQFGVNLRIGINLGDTILQGGDIYGDGVNIAARLEALAPTGGICISGIVKDSLGNRAPVPFEDMGLQTLKNIANPVHVFQWRPDTQPRPAAAATTKAAIAVLAFDNMSTDPEQEYFSDGIAEDIITALSHFRDFFVIARNTSFAFKGQPIRVDQICADLGVQYVLEGSVRKSGNRVRVTAQLIDGETGVHIWASKFDRALDDIFAVQDEITQAIVGAVAPETLYAETRRARAKRPESMSVWDKIVRARWHLGKHNGEDYEQSRKFLSEAAELEPENSEVHAALAHCDLMAMLHLWRSDTINAIASARLAAEAAVNLDRNNANAHAMLGMACMFARDFEVAERHLKQAIQLNPNLAVGYGNFAAYHGIAGAFEDARDAFEQAAALSPRDPLKAFWRGGYGIAAFVSGQYEICVTNAKDGLREAPGYASLMRQEAAGLAMLNRMDEAQASVARLLERMPGLTVEQVRKIVPVREEEAWERWLGALRHAGLPD